MGMNVTWGPIANINSDPCEIHVTSWDERKCAILREIRENGHDQISQTLRKISNNE